jgi:hypothetical protein
MVDAASVRKDMDALFGGVKCMVALGGFRVRRTLKMSDVEVRQAAEQTAGAIADIMVKLAAAEYVISMWAKEGEYSSAYERLFSQIEQQEKGEVASGKLPMVISTAAAFLDSLEDGGKDGKLPEAGK